MGSNPLVGFTVRADDQASPVLQQVKRNVEGLSGVVARPANELDYSMRNARGSLQLIARDLGITLPRAFQTFLASTPALGAALAGAFSGIALATFIPLISQMHEKIVEVTNNWGGYTKEVQKAEQANIEANKTAYSHLATLELTVKALAGINTELDRMGSQSGFSTFVQNFAKLTEKSSTGWSQLLGPAAQGYNAIADIYKALEAATTEQANREIKLDEVRQMAIRRGIELTKDQFKREDELKQARIEASQVGLEGAEKLAGEIAKLNVQQDAALRGLTQGTKAYQTVLDTFSTRKQQAINAAAVEEENRAWKQQTEELGRAFQQMERLAKESEKYKGMMPTDLGGINLFTRQAAYTPTELDAINQHYQKLYDEIDNLKTILPGYVDQLEAIKSAFGAEQQQKLEEYFDKQEKGWKDAEEAATKAVAAMAPPASGPGSPLDELYKGKLAPNPVEMVPKPNFSNWQDVNERMFTTRTILDSLNRGFDDMFTGIGIGTANAAQMWQNFANAIIDSMARIVAKMFEVYALQKLLGMIFPSLKGPLELSAGAGAVPLEPPTGVPGMIGFVPHDYPGPAYAGQSYRIGVPEIFTPSVNGYITPVSESKPLTVNVINQSSQPVKAKATQTVDAKGIVTNIVLSDFDSNGPISQAIRSGR